MAVSTVAAATATFPTAISDGLTPNVNVSFNIDDLTVLQLRLVLARLTKTNPREVASACSHVFGIMQAHPLSPSGRSKRPRKESRRQRQQRPPSCEGAGDFIIAPLPPAEADVDEDEVVADPEVAPKGVRVRKNPSRQTTKSGNPRKRKLAKEHVLVPWETRFQQLVEYKAKHGHARATRANCKEDPRFGQWCSNQRSFYRMLREGVFEKEKKKPKITAERISKLNSIGFFSTMRASKHGDVKI